jgi:hypothetical protein
MCLHGTARWDHAHAVATAAVTFAHRLTPGKRPYARCQAHSAFISTDQYFACCHTAVWRSTRINCAPWIYRDIYIVGWPPRWWLPSAHGRRSPLNHGGLSTINGLSSRKRNDIGTRGRPSISTVAGRFSIAPSRAAPSIPTTRRAMIVVRSHPRERAASGARPMPRLRPATVRSDGLAGVRA